MTYWQHDNEDDHLFLAPYMMVGHPTQRHLVATGRPPDATKAVPVFETAGVQILGTCGHADVIVMDELGSLESGAPAFQEAVMRRIIGDVPIIGVLKRSSTPFLDQLRAHPSIQTLEVTPANRDAMPALIASRLGLNWSKTGNHLLPGTEDRKCNETQ